MGVGFVRGLSVCVWQDQLAYRWPVRSPESSLAPATVCPTVIVKGFPETLAAGKGEYQK